MLKITIRDFVPPILPKLFKANFNAGRKGQECLFDGSDSKFKEIVSNSRTYAEYGCGASTIWVARECSCRLLSVDGSVEWVEFVESSCGDSSRVAVRHVDLGPLGKWGKPKSYKKVRNFGEYRNWIWNQGSVPDVVLVDGRFRVACFLTSLLKAKEGTVIIFDDYVDRENYHVVEKFISPQFYCGRQAFFRVSDINDKKRLEIGDLIDKFEYVMD